MQNECSATEDPATRAVPVELVEGASCYAYNAELSGECQGREFGRNSQIVETGRGNFLGQYPPVFYTTMSLLVGPDIGLAASAMRMTNSFLYVAMIALLAFLLPFHRRVAMITAVVLTAVPLTLFVVPSTNPSSWAILSASIVFFAVHGFYEADGGSRVALGAFAVVGTVIGAGARADAAAYAALAIVAAVVIQSRKSRKFVASTILSATLIIVSAVFYLTSRQSEATSAGLAPSTGPLPSIRYLLSDALVEVPDLWAGVFGRWPLGWIDTPLPAVVWVLSLGLFCAVAFLGIGGSTRRKTIVLLGGIAALWLIPTLLLVQSNATVGQLVQPRYLLPLVIILGGVALLREHSNPFRLTRLQAVAVISGLSLAQSIALHTNIRRYVTGSDVSGWNLDLGVEWWSNPVLSPMAAWLVGTACFTALLSVLAWFWSVTMKHSDSLGGPVTSTVRTTV